MMKKFCLIVACLNSTVLQSQDSLTSKQKLNDTIRGATLEEVIVSASRIKENILRSPVTIEKVNERYFRENPSPSFFDALENVKGVQMITPSLGFRVINTRGFANTTNVRFTQLVDGMDVQSPHIGSPIGNALGPSDLDIQHVEILPGVASALYGMNTINGLADFTTRDPFTSNGFSIQQKVGVMHFGDSNSNPKLFSETSVRYAHNFSSKFSVKLNATYARGFDWIADNHTDLNPNGNASTNLFGDDNPAQDPANGYGNESANRRTLSLQGKNYVVARTGYFEKEVVDYTLQNIKGDASLVYKISPSSTISYSFRMSLMDNVYQRSNRFRLEDYFIQQHGLRFQGKTIQAKVYFNNENSGQSYNLRSMSENMDRAYKSDNTWFNDYASAYNTAATNGVPVAEAHHQARAAADAGRYVPGTDTFNEVLGKLANINNWDTGAALRVKASFVHAEFQLNLTEEWLKNLKRDVGLNILAGADHRTYIIFPDGNYFINPEKPGGYDIHYSKTGGFVSVTKSLFQDKLKLGGILRADKNDYFDLVFNPRFTAVFSPSYKHNFRFSFQSGYRYPSIFEAYSNVNSGGVKRVGGIPAMSHGVFENAWLQASIASFQSAVLNDINRNGLTKNDAIIKNKDLLVKNYYTYIGPEHINSIEAGYKSMLFNGRLFADADFYFNKYEDFIAQTNMNVPRTEIADSITFYLYDRTKQSPYRMWTNSLTTVYNYGFSLGFIYDLRKGYTARANTSFTKLSKEENEDGLEDGFNTPQWMVNLSLANENIVKNIGASLSFRWQSTYYWQSFLVTGDVPSYATLDAQVSYLFEKASCRIKLGATNLTNHYYYSFLGGPLIGGFYYGTITFAPK